MRLLEFSKSCKQLLALNHVSTAFVNCDKFGGFIEEKIYEYQNDPDQIID